MSTKFQSIQIPPGVVTQPTKNVRSSNWAEVNLCRWIEGELQPVGGQSQYQWNVDPLNPIVGGYGDGDYSAGNYGDPTGPLSVITSLASRCKMIHGWYDLSGAHHVAYICEQNVYVDFQTSGTLYEITPEGGWPEPPAPDEGGYGDLNYGQDLPTDAPVTAYGTPRASGRDPALEKIPNMWSVDNFGAILLVMNSITGELLEWDPASPSNVLTRTTSPDTGTGFAPKGRCFVVTQERFVMIFGMTEDGTPDPDSLGRRFGWCDQEVRTAWDFSNVVSQAGFLDIEPASPIITAISGRFGNLFFTAQKAYVSRYLGLPYIYNYLELADNCTPWSAASIITTSSYVLWMSAAGMFSFDGTTVMPVPCLVRAWVTDDVDPINVREQACAVHLGDFSEFWWFFPQNGQPYNTRCIIFNYKDGWWSQGQMSRSAGITSSYTSQPIMADGRLVFQHELGTLYGNADPPWAETFDLNLTSGVRLVTLKQVIPDIRSATMQNVQFQFYWKNSRSLPGPSLAPNAGPAPTGTGQVTPGQWTAPIQIRPDGYVDARVTGRDIRMRISCVGPQITPFTLGAHLVDFAVRGDR